LEALAPDGVAGRTLELSRIGKPIDPSQAVGYSIYRSTDPNLPKNQWKKLNPVLLSQPQFNDTTRQLGVRYYYYVTSVNAYGVESPPSEVMTADPAAK
jgi:fibronectin type 3 domain-containing protein